DRVGLVGVVDLAGRASLVVEERARVAAQGRGVHDVQRRAPARGELRESVALQGQVSGCIDREVPEPGRQRASPGVAMLGESRERGLQGLLGAAGEGADHWGGGPSSGRSFETICRARYSNMP